MIKQMMDCKKVFKNSLAEADTEIINFFLWQLIIIKTVVEVFHISQSCSVVSDSLQPHGLYSSWNSPGQNTGVSSLSLLQGIFPTQGSNTRSPILWADSLPAEPYGKPKNIGVDSLSLLQGIFPTQESNQGLLHCRQILYQLSYQIPSQNK